jgi:hypothetical protein
MINHNTGTREEWLAARLGSRGGAATTRTTSAENGIKPPLARA